MASFTTLGFFHMSLIPSLKKKIGSSDQCRFGIHDIGAWSSLPGLLQNQSNFLIVIKLSFKRTIKFNKYIASIATDHYG